MRSEWPGSPGPAKEPIFLTISIFFFFSFSFDLGCHQRGARWNPVRHSRCLLHSSSYYSPAIFFDQRKETRHANKKIKSNKSPWPCCCCCCRLFSSLRIFGHVGRFGHVHYITRDLFLFKLPSRNKHTTTYVVHNSSCAAMIPRSVER